MEGAFERFHRCKETEEVQILAKVELVSVLKEPSGDYIGRVYIAKVDHILEGSADDVGDIGNGMIALALRADENEAGHKYLARITGHKGGGAFSQVAGSRLSEID